MTSTAYYRGESDFWVEWVEREWDMLTNLVWFEIANVITISLNLILIPTYTLIVFISFFKPHWWSYLPTSNLESYLPNAYAYWIYNLFWIPLPLYGQHQMIRNVVYWACYPILLATGPLNAVAVPWLSLFVFWKIFGEVIYEKST